MRASIHCSVLRRRPRISYGVIGTLRPVTFSIKESYSLSSPLRMKPVNCESQRGFLIADNISESDLLVEGLSGEVTLLHLSHVLTYCHGACSRLRGEAGLKSSPHVTRCGGQYHDVDNRWLIRLKCIYNFLCSMLVLTPFA
jgi:hypothetical protein